MPIGGGIGWDVDLGSGVGWVSEHHSYGRTVMSDACVDMAQGDISMHTAFRQSGGMGIGAA